MATKKSVPMVKVNTKAVKTAAKTAKKPTDSKRWSKVQLPDGFTAIIAGDFGEVWEFEEEPLIEGIVVGDVREVETGKGRNQRTSRVVNVKLESGRTLAVWCSAALEGFFDKLYDGAYVAIAFQGYRDVGKPQDMKVFVGGIYGDDQVDEDVLTARARTASKRRATRR